MNNPVLSPGSKAPDFNLKGVDGENHALSDYSDKKALLVIFSCNHCPYVKAYEDRIIDLQKRYGDKGLQIVAINSNEDIKHPEDSFESMKKRAEEKNFNFPYLRDESQEVAKAYGASHTPELFLFDEDRKLVYTGKIDDNWEEPDKVKEKYLENALNEVLEGKEVSVPETFAIGCTIKWR